MSKDYFVKKFNNAGLGLPAKVAPETKQTVQALYSRSEELIRKGAEYSKQEARQFGGCPRPGEPGSEKFFTEL